jgi:O-antigen/teichoic acid export membrane protein
MSISAKSYSILQRDVILFIARMLSGIVVARKLGPESLGLWAILQLIPGYAEAFGRFKFDIAAVYFLGKKKVRLGEMIFTLNLLGLTTALLIIIVIIFQFEWLYSQLFTNSPRNMRQLAYYTLAIIPLQFLNTNYSYLHIFREDIKTYNRIVLINALVPSGLGMILLIVFDLGIFAMLTGTIIGTAISLSYGAMKMLRIQKMIPNWNPRLLKEMAVYSLFSYLSGIVAHLSRYSINLITAIFLSPSQVAFYSMAQNRAIILSKIPNALSTLLFPKISKATNENDSAALAARAFRLTFLMLVFLGVILAIIIKPWVYILYGKAYLPVIIPFWIILPGMVIFQSSTVIGQYYGGVGRPDLSLKIGLAPMIIQVMLAYYLIQKYQIIGASISFLVFCVLYSFIQVAVFIQISTCRWVDLWITEHDYITVKAFIWIQINQITDKLSILYSGKNNRKRKRKRDEL